MILRLFLANDLFFVPVREEYTEKGEPLCEAPRNNTLRLRHSGCDSCKRYGFRPNYLYSCVSSLTHENTPCVGSIPTQGVFLCLLSGFAGSVRAPGPVTARSRKPPRELCGGDTAPRWASCCACRRPTSCRRGSPPTRCRSRPSNRSCRDGRCDRTPAS